MRTEDFGEALARGWRRYHELFGEVPHGTPKQMAALAALVPEFSKITTDSVYFDSADDGPEVDLIRFFRVFPGGSTPGAAVFGALQ
jgi:hypothetical protein